MQPWWVDFVLVSASNEAGSNKVIEQKKIGALAIAKDSRSSQLLACYQRRLEEPLELCSRYFPGDLPTVYVCGDTVQGVIDGFFRSGQWGLLATVLPDENLSLARVERTKSLFLIIQGKQHPSLHL